MGWCQPTFLVALYLKCMILPTAGLGLDWGRDGVGGTGILCPGPRNSTSQSFFLNSCNGSPDPARGIGTKLPSSQKRREGRKEGKKEGTAAPVSVYIRVDPESGRFPVDGWPVGFQLTMLGFLGCSSSHQTQSPGNKLIHNHHRFSSWILTNALRDKEEKPSQNMQPHFLRAELWNISDCTLELGKPKYLILIRVGVVDMDEANSFSLKLPSRELSVLESKSQAKEATCRHEHQL